MRAYTVVVRSSFLLLANVSPSAGSTHERAAGSIPRLLRARKLARLELPEALHEAVVAAQRMRAHEARTRQMPSIGKVKRQLELTALSRIRAALTPGQAVTPRP